MMSGIERQAGSARCPRVLCVKPDAFSSICRLHTRKAGKAASRALENNQQLRSATDFQIRTYGLIAASHES